MATCCDCSCGHNGIDPRSPCPAWLGQLLGARIRSAVEAVMAPAFLRIYSREFCGRSRFQRLSGSRSSRLSWSRLYDVCTRRQTRTLQNPRFYRPERDFQSRDWKLGREVLIELLPKNSSKAPSSRGGRLPRCLQRTSGKAEVVRTHDVAMRRNQQQA
jgi:hypothetical protein